MPKKSIRLLFGCAIASTIHGSLEAQFLDLDPLPPKPDLASNSIVESKAETLRSEIEILRDHDASDSIISTITATLQTQRRVAFLLLAQARTNPEAHHTAMAGLLLAREREEIDRLIVLLGGDPPQTVHGNPISPTQLAELLALLDRFCANATNLIESIDVTNRDDLDASLAFALEPLLEVLLALEERMFIDPWPSESGTSASPIEQYQSAIDGIKNENLKAFATATLEELKPMMEFPDLRPQAEADAMALAHALLLEHALEESSWITAPQREAIRLRLEVGIENWSDPSIRTHARAALSHLGALAELIEAANTLDRMAPESRASRRSLSQIISEDAELDRADQIHARVRRMARATTAIEAAISVRELEMKPPARHLLAARRALDQNYRLAEREVFERLSELVGTSSALMDPDLAGLVARQCELADDLQLLRDTASWSDFVDRHAPSSSKRFNSIVKVLAQQLAQSARRSEASLALDTMARQFGGALDPPFLQKLQAGELEAITLTGGRDRELLAIFESTREQLIEDWLDGAPDGNGARKFDQVIRLLEQLETLSVVIAAGGTSHLDRWGGWMLDPRAGRVDPSMLSSRLKLATQALLRDDEEALTRQLNQLDEEVPLARLAMRASAVLGNSLKNLPEGSAANVSRLAIAPNRKDTLFIYRDDLTELARYSWELEEAQRSGDPEQIAVIQAYCSALAQLIVEDLEKRPQPLPDLDPHTIGDDESSDPMR